MQNYYPIVKFDIIQGEDLPLIDRELLSKDQQYLYDIVSYVKTGGSISNNLETRTVAIVHNARLLTLASAFLRLYQMIHQRSYESWQNCSKSKYFFFVFSC